MSLIHPEGSICSLGELDLHAVPYSQKDIMRSQLVSKTPNNALTDTSTTFEFTFESNNLYTDLSEVEIYLEVTQVKADIAALTINQTSGPVNNKLHSLVDSMQMISMVRKSTLTTMNTVTKPIWRTCWGPRWKTKKSPAGLS